MSTKQVNPAMASYLKTLTQLENGSGGKSYREDQRPLDIKLRPGEVYAVITPDDDRFYRTVMVKENPFTTGFNFLVSNPVQGSIPPQMKVVAQHALFRQMREMNAFQNLEAFPFPRVEWASHFLNIAHTAGFPYWGHQQGFLHWEPLQTMGRKGRGALPPRRRTT